MTRRQAMSASLMVGLVGLSSLLSVEANSCYNPNDAFCRQNSDYSRYTCGGNYVCNTSHGFDSDGGFSCSCQLKPAIIAAIVVPAIFGCFCIIVGLVIGCRYWQRNMAYGGGAGPVFSPAAAPAQPVQMAPQQQQVYSSGVYVQSPQYAHSNVYGQPQYVQSGYAGGQQPVVQYSGQQPVVQYAGQPSYAFIPAAGAAPAPYYPPPATVAFAPPNVGGRTCRQCEHTCTVHDAFCPRCGARSGPEAAPRYNHTNEGEGTNGYAPQQQPPQYAPGGPGM